MEPIKDAEQISNIAFGFMASKALFVALHCEIFTNLSEGAKTAKMLADEAMRLGFVNRVLKSHDECNQAAQDMAAEIAKLAPMAVHGTKEIVNWSRDHTTDEALDRIALWNGSNLQPSELMAAMVAKQTKEPGQYASLPKLRKVDGRD